MVARGGTTDEGVALFPKNTALPRAAPAVITPTDATTATAAITRRRLRERCRALRLAEPVPGSGGSMANCLPRWSFTRPAPPKRGGEAGGAEHDRVRDAGSASPLQAAAQPLSRLGGSILVSGSVRL